MPAARRSRPGRSSARSTCSPATSRCPPPSCARCRPSTTTAVPVRRSMSWRRKAKRRWL
uniref:Uncharacterized protein n=1 Tax=Arundo donax TaxID=35708 RepID=A0A0A8XNF2_ARUDO